MYAAVVIALIPSRNGIGAENPSQEDRAFLTWDMQIEIQQQDMGHLAVRRAETQEVRNLGNNLAEWHRQRQQRLQEVAKQLGVALTNNLSEIHLTVQRHYSAISSASFDKAFVHHEVGDYRYFLRHFEMATASGGPAVRAFATAEIPRLKEEQTQVLMLMRE
jgi:putative membrane protein